MTYGWNSQRRACGRHTFLRPMPGVVVLDLGLNGYDAHYSPFYRPISLNRAFCSSLSDA